MNFDQLLKLITAVGIPTIIIWCISTGRKLQILDNLRDDVREIKNDIRNLWQSNSSNLKDIAGLKVKVYGTPGSPMNPNDQGKKLLEDSGFYRIYPELKQELFGLMDSWGLRTLYDYEKGAEKALQELQNSPLLDSLKEYAVNHPEESLELIFRVAAWIIRDDYAEYKNRK